MSVSEQGTEVLQRTKRCAIAQDGHVNLRTALTVTDTSHSQQQLHNNLTMMRVHSTHSTIQTTHTQQLQNSTLLGWWCWTPQHRV